MDDGVPSLKVPNFRRKQNTETQNVRLFSLTVKAGLFEIYVKVLLIRTCDGGVACLIDKLDHVHFLFTTYQEAVCGSTL
jgi:hypothetical protein